MEFPNSFISASKEMCCLAKHVPAPMLRKSFVLNSSYERAEIVIAGLGFYDLYFNGKRITKGHMAPYISNPDDIICYDRYDVTALLRRGENVIGVLLGNGMQNAFGAHAWGFDTGLFCSAPKLSLRFSAQKEEDIFAFAADESFKTADSPILFDEYRLGEFYDASKEQSGWCDVGFCDDSWTPAFKTESPRGEKMLCEAEPICEFENRRPVSIAKSGEGYVYDFGVNDAGVCRLTVTGTAGQEISMEHGEVLREGILYTQNIKISEDGYTQRAKYTCKGNRTEIYQPRFAYFGFRYVYVTGIEPQQATEELLTYVALHSDIQERGDFSCSDNTINTLQKMTRRSTLSNFHYFLTDCPQREKNGWTADAALSAEQCLLNFGPEKSFRFWLKSVRKAMNEDGALPGIVPTTGWGFAWGNGPAWDSVLVYLPYYVYIYRGDTQILKENEAAIFRYLHYLTTRLDEKGLLAIGLGDWCNAGRGAEDYKAPLSVTDSIIAMDLCQKAMCIYEALDKPLSYEFAERFYKLLRSNIRRHLVDRVTMTVLGDCQTSQSMALFYGVFDEGETQAAFDKLLALVRQANDHIDVGVLGGRVIFHTLSRFGYAGLAYQMITNKTFPSYAYWIEKGATTLIEEFIPDDWPVSSQNHHFWGDISAWFIKSLAGIHINPTGKNHNEVLVAPHFIKELDHASAFHIAPSGRLEVLWQREADTINLRVYIPEGMIGKIQLENGFVLDGRLLSGELHEGENTITINSI